VKRAIITVVSGDKYNEIWKRSEPFFINYAERCDAELIVLHGTDGINYPSPHWIKFSIYELLKEFDRIAFMDADIIIRDDCPSLFDVVPEDKFGIFNEGQFAPRAICIQEVRKVYNVDIKKWNGTDYYNTGVFVVSKKDRYIFKITEEIKHLRNSFGEQTFLNMKLMANPQTEIFNLPWTYNRMSLMDRPTGMTRLNSYIIHYAGDGDKLLEKMDRDIKRWAEDGPEYKYNRKIFIWSLGGLGDCIASEPVIRYIKRKVYPKDDVYVMSESHDFYKHIPDIFRSKGYPKGDFDAIHEMNTHQTPWGEFGKLCPFVYVHTIDWASMATIGRMLPDKDKQITLTYSPEELKEASDVSERLDDLVLVHPGFGWESKTFPLEYWQKIVDDIDDLGLRVGIIGKHQNELHSVLDIKCPPGGVDFRDKLSLNGTIALISKAHILITNDSAPLFMAGAFKNYIILLPTCKHPDLIMPFRNGGDKYWRSAALYKKLIEDDDFRPPTSIGGWSMKCIPEGHKIEEYIPEVSDVIDKIIDFNGQWEESHCPNKLKENDNEEKYGSADRNRSDFMEPYERGLRHAVRGEIVHACERGEVRC